MEKDTNKALLVMDMQGGTLASLPNKPQLISHVEKAIALSRNKKIPVIYVIVGFRPGMPEISPSNKGFAAARERFASMNMNEFMKIDVGLAPLPDDIIVVKRRVSAFAGSDLEVVLRALGIQHLVLTGVATGGVVLSTLREAADKDYRLTVLADCCADSDPEVHQVLTNKVFPRQADVLTVDRWNAQ